MKRKRKEAEKEKSEEGKEEQDEEGEGEEGGEEEGSEQPQKKKQKAITEHIETPSAAAAAAASSSSSPSALSSSSHVSSPAPRPAATAMGDRKAGVEKEQQSAPAVQPFSPLLSAQQQAQLQTMLGTINKMSVVVSLSCQQREARECKSERRSSGSCFDMIRGAQLCFTLVFPFFFLFSSFSFLFLFFLRRLCVTLSPPSVFLLLISPLPRQPRRVRIRGFLPLLRGEGRHAHAGQSEEKRVPVRRVRRGELGQTAGIRGERG